MYRAYRFSTGMALAALVVCISASTRPVLAATKARDLRCEYLTNPLGIHETAPRLSWIMESSRRGDHQTGYRVLVASSAQMLAEDKGDMWDSGKVASPESAHVVYAGAPLDSRQAGFWKTRVWDRDGKPSAWSPIAHWSMGLLHPEDWKAQWIDAKVSALSDSAKGPVVIRKATYEATDGSAATDVTGAVANMVQGGRLSVLVDNIVLGGDPAKDHTKQLRVAYEMGGKAHEVVVGEKVTLTLPEGGMSLPYLRKSFSLTNPVRHASLYATSLGIYEMRLNGQRVGDIVLAPDWTDYRKRIRYQEYDVTSLVHTGENAIGAMVGNGWYSGHLGNGGFQYYGTAPALFAQLEVTYADGKTETIATDGTWKTHPSPILSSDYMLGENYDARMEIKGWDKPGLDEKDWGNTFVRAEALPSVRPFEPQVSPPVRVLRELKPKSVTEAAPGHWVFDLGQNMVGVVRLKVAAPAGTKVTIHHAEMLNKDGTIYTANLRGAPSVDTFTLADSPETWHPRFTFHGFRYVELTGLPGKPTIDAVTGVVLGSDTPLTGQFACSDPRINQLQSNIEWGQRGNYLSVPTDCPQRDERMGWMGDAEVFVRTATYNADVASFFTKWLVDVDDAQTPDGAYSDISPSYGGGGTPAWADAGVICPWTIYLTSGDTRILEKHLPNMTRWVEWCRVHSTGLIRDKDRNGDYGDWLAIGSDTPKDLIGTAFFAYSTHLVAKSYAAVGNTDQAAKYRQLFEEIKAAFNAKYVQPDGRIFGNTQCCYAMALKFELLPENLRAKAAQYLEDDIKGRGWHLSTGFVGVSYLLPMLTQAGKVDTAYKLLFQDTFPSWLFSVKHGATTIWERWDGWTPEKGFQDPGMNSFNHYSLGSCGEWLYDSAAGIAPDPAQPGYAHMIVHPRVAGGLTWVKAHYDSIHGRIESRWASEGDKVTLNVTIPANTTATVFVPAGDTQAVTESGKAAAHAEGVKYVRSEAGAAVYEVGSGSYEFHSTLK